jgi:hypothetical protein
MDNLFFTKPTLMNLQKFALGLKAVAAHIAVSAVNYAIAGAIVGWVLGYGKKAAVV